MKRGYRYLLLTICSLMLTGSLSLDNTRDSNSLQETSAPGDIGSEAVNPTLLTPDNAANLDNGTSSQIVNNPNYPQGVIIQNRQQSITLPDETSNSQTTGEEVINHFERSISYFTKWALWNMSNDVLLRDFSRFKSEGIQIVNLALHWYRLEGNNRGDYYGKTYGNTVLDGVKRAIVIAELVGLKVRICPIFGWNDPSIVPDYVIDPVTGKNIALAIVRSSQIRQAFLEMYNHTISSLSGMPIWGWTILGEPWYDPFKLDPPYDGIDQKDNFITLIQNLATLIKSGIGNSTQVDVNFCMVHYYSLPDGSPRLFNIFEHQFQWDGRIFQTLDSIRFSYHPFEALQKWPDQPEVYEKYVNITRYTVEKCLSYNKQVSLTLGTDGDELNDDAIQETTWAKMLSDIKNLPLSGMTAFAWNSEERFIGMNLCDNEKGDPRPAYFVFLNFKY